MGLQPLLLKAEALDLIEIVRCFVRRYIVCGDASNGMVAAAAAAAAAAGATGTAVLELLF